MSFKVVDEGFLKRTKTKKKANDRTIFSMTDRWVDARSPIPSQGVENGVSCVVRGSSRHFSFRPVVTAGFGQHCVP